MTALTSVFTSATPSFGVFGRWMSVVSYSRAVFDVSRWLCSRAMWILLSGLNSPPDGAGERGTGSGDGRLAVPFVHRGLHAGADHGTGRIRGSRHHALDLIGLRARE